MKQIHYDVLVIGGGPAGSCVAIKLAQQGLQVLVIEGKCFPRPHIGESLLATSMPLLHDLGVAPRLEKTGFAYKTGAVFVWDESGQELELGMPYPGYAYQVERARFDQLLLDHAQELGVEVAFEHWVRNLLRDEAGRVSGVRVEKDGALQDVRCHFVVDASGLAQRLPRLLHLPMRTDGPRRVALGSYFTGALRPEIACETNIISEACQDGWLWFIPLSERVTSVGFVTDEDLVQGQPVKTLLQQIATTKLVKRLLAPATLSSSINVLRYTNHIVDAPLWGDGYILVGDSAMFVDPLFSTGVHGALYSATLAAAGLAAVLTDTVSESEAATWYHRSVMKHFLRVNETIKMLYSSYPGSSLFWRRRDLSQINQTEAEDIVNRLGFEGVRFFSNTANANVLKLPTLVTDYLAEFQHGFGYGQTEKPQPLSWDALVSLAPEIEVTQDLMNHQGHLKRAIVVSHQRNRTRYLAYPLDSLYGKMLQKITTQTRVSEAFAALMADEKSTVEPSTHQKIALWLGFLVGDGLLTQVPGTEMA